MQSMNWVSCSGGFRSLRTTMTISRLNRGRSALDGASLRKNRERAAGDDAEPHAHSHKIDDEIERVRFHRRPDVHMKTGQPLPQQTPRIGFLAEENPIATGETAQEFGRRS
jgi:hypothetical protein